MPETRYCAIKDRAHYCPECGSFYGGWIVRDGIWQGLCWRTHPGEMLNTATLSKRQGEG